MENTGSLAPPLFPYRAPVGERPEGSPTVPFGITKALPIERPQIADDLSKLRLCPEQQVSLSPDGEPFLDSPSMGSSIATVRQSQEDMQVFDDHEGVDTD